MKSNIIIFIMLLILLSLITQLSLSNEKKRGELQHKRISWEQEELSIFVTLENQIARNDLLQGTVTVSKTKEFYHQKQKYENAIYEVERELERDPEYVSNYPILYSEPLSREDEMELDSHEENEQNKICYLTFDDGPSKNTWEILNILDEKKMKATFFIIGESWTQEEKDCLSEVVRRGHTIGIHAYQHDYKKLYHSVDSFLKDYETIYQMVIEVTGTRPNLYRFPGGSYNSYAKKIREQIIAEMERRGFTYYDWNVSGEDSVGHPTKASIKKNVFRDMERYDAPVVLLHDGQINDMTVKVLPELIEEIKAKGYGFGTLNHREPCQFTW